MNIVFLMQDTGALYGAERATLALINGLRRAGVECRALLIEERRLSLASSALRSEIERAAIPYSVVPTARAMSWDLVREIRDAFRAYGGDVLHCVGYKADVHGFFTRLGFQSVPLVTTVHGWLFRHDLKERFYEWLDRMVLRRFDRVIVLSRYYEQLVQCAGVAKSRVVRIPTGLDPTEYAPFEDASTASECVVGMFGRLSDEKNHRMFLDAWRLVHRQVPRAIALIAGDGPLRADLERQVAAMGPAKVVLERHLAPKEFFSRVHVLAVCSLMENLPFSILEAMAFGRPVVATRVGGIPDLVDNEQTGYLVPPTDVNVFAQKLAQLCNDAERRKQMGRAARAKLEREFTLSQQVVLHENLYKRCLGQ